MTCIFRSLHGAGSSIPSVASIVTRSYHAVDTMLIFQSFSALMTTTEYDSPARKSVGVCPGVMRYVVL